MSARQSRYPSIVLLAGLATALIVGGSLLPSWAEIIDDNTPVPPVGAWGGPSEELDDQELEQWKRGRKVFDRDFRPSDGLGTPELNGDSCRGCHKEPVIGGAGGLDINVFRFAKDNGGMGPFEDFPDGQAGSKLRRVDVPGRENHDPTADVFEQRQTPLTVGLGLIDSIPDSVIMDNEDPNDINGDGITGVARMHEVDGLMEVGKLGWKSQIPRLSDFIRDAMGGELGMTVPVDNRGFGMTTDGDTNLDPELAQEDADDMLFFLAFLAPPPRGGSTDPAVAQGEAIFASVGCDGCHTPSLQGADGPVALYSDLLLHNVFPDTFRGMWEEGAGVGEYRTPPLWGISKSAPYFHDGRAETLQEAIEIHAGEADGVIEDYFDLSAADKEALVRFLEDL